MAFPVDPRGGRALSLDGPASPIRRLPVTSRSLLVLLAAALFVAAPADAAAKSARHRTSRRSAAAPDLVWYVETVDGHVLDARREDLPINPASVVKIAT